MIAGLVFALLLATTSPVQAQQTPQARTLTDVHGRTVTVSPDGRTYTVTSPDGFHATVQPNMPGDDAAALATINAMEPNAPPVAKQ